MSIFQGLTGRHAWVLLLGAMPMLASAQFTVLEQQARLYASVNSSASPSPSFNWEMASIPSGELGSQSLSVLKQVDDVYQVISKGSFQSTASSSELGLSGAIGLSFLQRAALPSEWYVSGEIRVEGSMTFKVDQAVEVSVATGAPAGAASRGSVTLGRVVAVQDGAATGPYPNYLTTPVQSVGGKAWLEAGDYVLTLSSIYADSAVQTWAYDLWSGQQVPVPFDAPTSLAWAGTSVKITAVPEPSTLWLGALGLCGLCWVGRRRYQDDRR